MEKEGTVPFFSITCPTIMMSKKEQCVIHLSESYAVTAAVSAASLDFMEQNRFKTSA